MDEVMNDIRHNQETRKMILMRRIEMKRKRQEERKKWSVIKHDELRDERMREKEEKK